MYGVEWASPFPALGKCTDSWCPSNLSDRTNREPVFDPIPALALEYGEEVPSFVMGVMEEEQQQKRDARILALILKGQLQASSSISDDSGETVLLADHDRFGKLLRLGRAVRSLEVVGNTSWWGSRESSFRAKLAEMPLWAVLYRLSREHATGFLTVHHSSRIKVVGISAGVVLAVHSNLKREQTFDLLVQKIGLKNPSSVTDDRLENAQKVAKEAAQPFEWGAISTGAIDADTLLTAMELQVRHRLLDTFEWHEGHLAFHPDPRAGQLESMVNLPLLALLRNGVWQKDTLGTAALREICKPLIGEQGEGQPLALLRSVGTLQFELTASETVVINGAKAHKTAQDILSDVEERRQGTEIHALRALYLFFELGLVGLRLQESESQPEVMPLNQRPVPGQDSPFTEETAPGVQATSGRMTGPNHLSEYRLQLDLEKDGRRLLQDNQIDEAISKFSQLVARQDRPTQALAYLSIATLLRQYPDRDKSVELARQALKNDAESALAHAALSRALGALGRDKAAEQHRTQALSIAQHNDTWFSEVECILALGREKPVTRARTTNTHMKTLITILLATFGGLFLLANMIPMGQREYFYDGRDAFFFVRRVWLLVAGLLGLYLTSGRDKGFLKNLGFSASVGLLLGGAAWGGLVGFLSPPQRIEAGLAVVLYLTLFHVIAEEIFFRGFVTRTLLSIFDADQWQLAVGISAVLFGVYHLTYYSFWYETAFVPKIYFSVAITIMAGLPYAWLYHKSRSILPAFVCHLLVNGVMMVMSSVASL